MSFNFDDPFGIEEAKKGQGTSGKKKGNKKPKTSVMDFGFTSNVEGIFKPSTAEQKSQQGNMSDLNKQNKGNQSSTVGDGMKTMVGMAPQYVQSRATGKPVMTQGPNYANPGALLGISSSAYSNSVINTGAPPSPSMKSSMSKKQTRDFAMAGGYTAAAQKEFAKIPAMKQLATSKQQTYKGVKVSNAGSAARLKLVNRANYAAEMARKKSDPSLGLANSIMSQLGSNYRYGTQTVRRRRSHYYTAWAKIYVGPSTRRSYSRTIHNGRQVTAYRGLSTGQIVSAEGPHGVVDNYYKRTNLVNYVNQNDFGVEKTNKLSGLASTYAFYDTIVGVAKQRKSAYETYAEPLGTETRAKIASLSSQLSARNRYLGRLQQPRGLGSGAAYQWQRKRDNDPTKLRLQSEIAELQKQVGGFDLYGYLNVSDTQIGQVKDYHGQLTEYHGELDSGISLLQQGIAKEDASSGVYSEKRQLLQGFGAQAGLSSSLKTRREPITADINKSTSQLEGITSELKITQTKFNTREAIHKNLNSLGVIPSGGTVNVATAITTLEGKVEGAKAGVTAANARYQAVAGRRTSNRSAMRSKERQLRSLRGSVNSANSNLSRIQGTITQLKTQGDVFDNDEIGQSLIATSGNLTMRGNRTGKRNWYRGATGTTTIHVPKDKIPESGKVMVEATISYSSGYKGRTHADTTFGRVQGSGTFKKELTVDANGNIVISAKMYGTNYGQQAVSTISGIKIYDSSKISTYNKIQELTTQRNKTQSILNAHNTKRASIDSAQSFLGGNSGSFNVAGKQVASLSNDKFTINDQDTFSEFFGNTSETTFKAAKSLTGALGTINTKRTEANTFTDEVKKSTRLKNLSNTEAFITGKSSSLTLRSGDKDIIAATRGQKGNILVKDNTVIQSLGVKLPEKYIPDQIVAATGKIGALEASLEAKDSKYNTLMGTLGVKRTEQIKRTSTDKINELASLAKDHLITRRERNKGIADVNKDKAAALKQVEDKEYFPDVDTVSDETTDQELDKFQAGTRKVLKRNRQIKALSNVTKARAPRTSIVGKRSNVVQRPRSSTPRSTTAYRGDRQVPVLPFFQKRSSIMNR